MSIYNGVARSRQALAGRDLTDPEWEAIGRQDAQLIGAVLQAAVGLPEQALRARLSLSEHAELHVERAAASLQRPVLRQAMRRTRDDHVRLAHDPSVGGLDRRESFLAVTAINAQFAVLLLDAARDLVAARVLIPNSARQPDALGAALGRTVPQASDPLIRGMSACFSALDFARAELMALNGASVLDVDARAPGLLTRMKDVTDHFASTSILQHRNDFGPDVFRRVIGPSLGDLKEGLLDVLTLAIEARIGDASSTSDSATDSATDPVTVTPEVFAGECLDVVLRAGGRFVAMIDLADRAVDLTQAMPRALALQVSALTAQGVRVPAQLESGTRARSVAGPAAQFELADGQWHAADTDLSAALAELPAAQETTASPLVAARSLRSAESLIGLDPAEDVRPCLEAARSVYPETLATRYGELARRWQGRASAMEGLSTRLETLVADGALDADRGSEAAQALRAQAASVRTQFDRWPLHTLRAEFIKCHARPQSRLWAELLESGQAVARAPRMLRSPRPGTLYEIEIRPADGPLAGQHQPAVWAHLHLLQPVAPGHLAQVTMADLAAAHLKSDADRNLGAEWQARQRAAGREDVQIHRSPLDDRLLSLVLGRQAPAP